MKMHEKSKSTYDTNEDPNEVNQEGDALSLRTKVGYGTGDVFNDMASVISPGYTLLYLKSVIGLNDSNSGLVVSIGLICTGLSSGLIGFLVALDTNCFLYHHYGKRKTWHLIGTIFVVVSFPFLCLAPIGFGLNSGAFPSFKENVFHSKDNKIYNANTSSPECVIGERQYEITLYYTIITIFQSFGRAAIQTSHLSMIPYLTTCDRNQVTLNSIRNSAMAASYIFMHSISSKFFDSGNKAGEQTKDELQRAFQNIMYIIVTVGVVSSCLFHLLVKEKSTPLNTKQDKQNLVRQLSTCRSSRMSIPFIPTALPPHDKQPDTIHEMKICEWFLEPQFYLIALHYMTTKLFFQISIIYAPLFVSKTLKLPNTYMATVLLAMYVAGLLFSGATNYLSNIVGLKKSFVPFCIFGLGGCLWIFFGCNNWAYYTYEVYGIAIIIGGASSAMLILSSTLIAAFIGYNIGKRK